MHKRYGPLALGLRAGREGVRRVTNTAGVPTGYVLREATIDWQQPVRETEGLIISGLILQNRTLPRLINIYFCTTFLFSTTLQYNKIIILYNDQQIHIYFTNYHTATCFDTTQTACNQYLAKLHQYVKCSCW
jgi:hypothetical protein